MKISEVIIIISTDSKMDVNKSKNHRSLLRYILVFALIESLKAVIKCDLPLMSKYMLTGSEYSVASPMKLCGHVNDRCCTISDEIKLSKLWNYRTLPLLQRHRERTVDHISQITHYFYNLTALDPQMILVKHLVTKQIPYKYRACQAVRSKATQQDKKFARRYYKQSSQEQVNSPRINPFNTTFKSRNPCIQLQNTPNAPRDMYQGVYIRDLSQRCYEYNQRKVSKIYSSNSLEVKPLVSFRNTNIEDAEAQESQNKLENFLTQEVRNKTLNSNKTSSQNFANNASDASFQGAQLEIVGKINPNRTAVVHSNIRNDRNSPNTSNPNSLNNKRNLAQHHHRSIGRLSKYKQTGGTKRRFYNQKARYLESKSMAPEASLFTAANGTQTIYSDKIQCFTHASNFTKEFVVINNAKAKFCFGIYRKFLDFDIEMFTGFLSTIKGMMTSVLENKKMFYCSLCDAHTQKFFDHKQNVVMYEQEYCRRLIVEKADYIKFMNVVFIEFADQMLQYIQCFESDAKVFAFPFQNLLMKYKRRIPFWNKCLAQADGKGFMASCWSMCNKLSIQRISPLWDGDIHMLERVSISILSFLRKFKIQETLFLSNSTNSTRQNYTAENVFNIRSVNNVDGMLTEPMNPSLLITNKKFIGDKDLRNWILGKNNLNETSDDTVRKTTVIDKYLEYLGIGEIDEIKNMLSKPFNPRSPRRANFNDTLFENADRYNSTVNGLVNKLYNLTLETEIYHNDLPARYLRDKYMSVILDSGFKLKPVSRHLTNIPGIGTSSANETSTLQANNSSSSFESNLISPEILSPVSPSNYSDINSMGFQVNHNYTQSYQEKEESNLPIESPGEFFEKTKSGIDVTLYGAMFDSEGLNPLTNFALTMFNYNVSSLIGLQFKSPEKIINPVIEIYMKATPKFINKFNFSMKDPIMGYKEVIESFPDFKKMRRYEMVQKTLDMKSMPALNSKMEKDKQKIMTDLKAQSHQSELKAIRERDYKEMNLARERQKIDDREKIRSHDHTSHKNFGGLFAGIKQFFIDMFGS
jgi:hypothetical protein